MKRLNKLKEAQAIVKQTKHSLARIDALKISLRDRSQFANELGAAYEALEFLRVKLQAMILKGEIK